MSKSKKKVVRVSGGSLKGRRLEYPPERILRPTTGRTREALFDTLGKRVDGCVFVDLCCAAGGIGIEAISRGASMVHFVENHPLALELLRANLGACAVDEARFRVHAADAVWFLESGALERQNAGIVFADPPYSSGLPPTIMAHFENNAYDLLETLIIEHRGALDTTKMRKLRLEKTRRYGDTYLTFLEPVG